jgi:hypothetical protein
VVLPLLRSFALNNCTDLTEQVARSVEVPFALDIHSVWLPPSDANAGTARRLAMDKAILSAGRGIVMTTDADAIAPPEWVALNARALTSGADVVCGQAESIRRTPRSFRHTCTR